MTRDRWTLTVGAAAAVRDHVAAGGVAVFVQQEVAAATAGFDLADLRPGDAVTWTAGLGWEVYAEVPKGTPGAELAVGCPVETGEVVEAGSFRLRVGRADDRDGARRIAGWYVEDTPNAHPVGEIGARSGMVAALKLAARRAD